MSCSAAFSSAFLRAVQQAEDPPIPGGIVLGPHVITVVRPGRKGSDYGTGTVPDWDSAIRTSYSGCSVQPVLGSEYTVDRDSVTSRWQAWVGAACDVTSGDRVEWGGNSYDVDGEVQRWAFPSLDHQVVPLTRSADT